MFVEKHVPFSLQLQVQNKFIICQSRKVFAGMDICKIYHLCYLIKLSPQFHEASVIDPAFTDLETKMKYLITH